MLSLFEIEYLNDLEAAATTAIEGQVPILCRVAFNLTTDLWNPCSNLLTTDLSYFIIYYPTSSVRNCISFGKISDRTNGQS